MPNQYVPGVCNIGPTEIAMRRRVGWAGLGVTVLALAALMYFHVSPAWRLILILPASLSATGFLQAALHFCAGFGMRGIFNFGTELGKGDTVMQVEFRATDKKRAQQIFGYSLIIGALVAIAAYYL